MFLIHCCVPYIHVSNSRVNFNSRSSIRNLEHHYPHLSQRSANSPDRRAQPLRHRIVVEVAHATFMQLLDSIYNSNSTQTLQKKSEKSERKTLTVTSPARSTPDVKSSSGEATVPKLSRRGSSSGSSGRRKFARGSSGRRKLIFKRRRGGEW